MSSIVSFSVFSSRSSPFHVSPRVALFMDSILAIGAGLGLRFVVDAATHQDLKLSGALVGLWEGIVLLHFLQKFPYSFDPYVGYGVRLFVDFLVTENLARFVLVVIWTGLGMVLADVTPGLWKETGMHRKWHNLRRELYLLTRSVPTIPPLFPKQRTVRFSPSRTTSVVSSADRSEAGSRAPSEISVSTTPPRRTFAVPQTPRAPRRAVPGFFQTSSTSETGTERSTAVIRPAPGFSDTESVITTTTTNIGTASGYTRHEVFTPTPVAIPVPVAMPVPISMPRPSIDEDNYSSDESSTTTEVPDPSSADVPEIIVPDDPPTPRQQEETLVDFMPEREPERELDHVQMPPTADIPDIFDNDWETVDKEEAVPEEVVPPPLPPKDEEPLFSSAVTFDEPRHSTLFSVDKSAPPSRPASQPQFKRPVVSTPEPKPVPPPSVVESGPPKPPVVMAQRAPVKPALQTTTGYTAPPKSVISMATARFAPEEETPSEAGGPAESVDAAGHPLPNPTPSEAPSRWGGATVAAGHPLPNPTPSEAPSRWGGATVAAGHPLPNPTPSEAPSRWGAQSRKPPTEAPRAPDSVLSYQAPRFPQPEPTPSEAPSRWGAESDISYGPTEVPRAPESIFGLAPSFPVPQLATESVVGARHPLPEPTPSEAPTRWGAASVMTHNAAGQPLPDPTPSEAPSRWGGATVAAGHPLPNPTPSEAPSRWGGATVAAGHPLPNPTPSEAPTRWGAESVVSHDAAGHPLPNPTPSEAPSRWGGATVAAGQPLPNPTPSEAPSRWGGATVAAEHPLPNPTPSEAPSRWAGESINPAHRRIAQTAPSEAPTFVKAARQPLPEPTPSEKPESVLSSGTGAARHALPPSEAPWGAESTISVSQQAARHPLPEPTPSEAQHAQDQDESDAPPPPYPELWDANRDSMATTTTERAPSPVPSVSSELSIKAETSILRDALQHRLKMIGYVKLEAELMRDVGELKEDGSVGGLKSRGLKAAELKAVRSKMAKMGVRAEERYYAGATKKTLSNEMDVSSLTAPKAVDLVERRLAALVAADLIDKPALVTMPKGTKGRPVKQKILNTLKEHGFKADDDPNNGRVVRVMLPKK